MTQKPSQTVILVLDEQEADSKNGGEFISVNDRLIVT
jgi:hypothetical protein